MKRRVGQGGETCSEDRTTALLVAMRWGRVREGEGSSATGEDISATREIEDEKS